MIKLDKPVNIWQIAYNVVLSLTSAFNQLLLEIQHVDLKYH